MLADHNYKLRMNLLKSKQSVDKEMNYKDTENRRREKFNRNIEELLDNWWNLVKKVLKCFEDNPQYIKKEHLPLIDELFEAYLFRKSVLGEKIPKDNYDVYGEDIFTKHNETYFVEIFKKLTEKLILKI